MARIAAKVVGHGVIPVNLPLWIFRKVARQQKIDPYQIALLIRYVEDNKQGAFSYQGGVTHVMEELTGSPAESFETTARRYADMPFARQTLANRIKSFVNFNITPFYPGYNIEAYERSLQLPTPEKPMQCMEDEQWKASHAEQMALQGKTASVRGVQHEANPMRLSAALSSRVR
jgi:hypothetical protein